jgi:peptidoglycan hydrolase CwlO-like protein
MNALIDLAKKFPWWLWVALVVFIIFVWQTLSGGATSRKLYNMALDQLREDQTGVVQQRDEWIATCEKQILDLQDDIEKVQKEKAVERARAAEVAAEVVRLKGRINALQVQIDNIVVSNDPDIVLDSLRKLGIRSIKRRHTP